MKIEETSRNEILEGNRLIAKFIGLTPHEIFPNELDAPDEFNWMAVKINMLANYDRLDNEFKSFDNYFEFHSSWAWLMPVVEKIENMSITEKVIIKYSNDKLYEVIIIPIIPMQKPILKETEAHWIEDIEKANSSPTNSRFHKIRFIGNDKILCIWLAVIEFIKYFNIIRNTIKEN